MKKNRTVLIILILIFVFGILLIPGPRGANDFPYAFLVSVKEGFNLPQLWTSRSEGLGAYMASTLWAWPIDVLYGLGAKLNIDFSILERLIGILPTLIVGVWGIRKLLKYYGVKEWGNLIGTILYLINTYVLLLIDGGQLAIALAYAWLPVAYLAFIKSIGGSIKPRLLAALSVIALGFFDIRFVYVLAILLGLNFLYQLLLVRPNKWLGWFFGWLKSGLLTGILMLGLNAYWIIPSILAKAPMLPASYTQVSQTSFLNFASLGHALFLLAPHWYKNVFGQVTHLLPLFVFIPILVFLAPILRRKDKAVGFWLIIALVSIFLAKGANPPLGEIYNWLFSHVPGFLIFRDSTKFFFLVALSYSVLTAITVDEIIKRLPKLKIIFPMLLATYYMLLIYPVYTGKMTGMLSPQPNQNEYFRIADILQSDKEFGRILWMPGRPPLGFSSPTHPSVDALLLTEKKPYVSLITGTYELLNYLRNPFAPQLLDVSGIAYISYPYPDTRRTELKQDNIDYYYWFLGKLESYSWLTPIVKDGNVPLLEINNHQDKFFIPANLFWVRDSQNIYQDLSKMPDFKLSENALVFVDDNPDLIKRSADFPSSKVVDWGKLSERDKIKLFRPGSTPKVSYQEISPTEYRVSVEGLKEPGVLAFSETYDPLWQANGKGSIPLYNLINGFPIEKDGQYDIYFSPQKYVIPGLVVSSFTLLGIIVALLLLK